VLDHTDPQITYDQDGVCNYCHGYQPVKEQLRANIANSESYFRELKTKLSSERRDKYDAIVGLSGGVDSSYVALLAKRLGLNPLLVHFDNGWNSEIAVANIKRISNTCGFDLETYVIDWEEFRDLQRAFIKASVVDIEMLTDHAIFAALIKLSRQFKIKNILSGTNWATEWGLPQTWVWNKLDFANISAIHQKFGEKKLRTFPHISNARFIVLRKLGFGVSPVEMLNHIAYRKCDAMVELQREFGWEYYGGKHYESVFTKFYQSYILPTKFNIDKRKAHLSSLIRNDESTREQALEALKEPLYLPEDLEQDMTFVLKKLGFSRPEFDELMGLPPIPHDHYGTDRYQVERLYKMYYGARDLVGLRKKATT
jgi:N-acetyl sugar amidotransferase